MSLLDDLKEIAIERLEEMGHGPFDTLTRGDDWASLKCKACGDRASVYTESYETNIGPAFDRPCIRSPRVIVPDPISGQELIDACMVRLAAESAAEYGYEHLSDVVFDSMALNDVKDGDWGMIVYSAGKRFCTAGITVVVAALHQEEDTIKELVALFTAGGDATFAVIQCLSYFLGSAPEEVGVEG